MAAVLAFILFAVNAGASPDLTALGTFDSKASCQAAAKAVAEALAKGEDGKTIVCVSSDSLQKLAADNPA